MLRLPSRSGAGSREQDSSRQSPIPSPSESLPGEQDYPLLPGPGRPQLLSPGPGMWAPRDRSGWEEARGAGVGLGKGATGRCQMELRGPGTVGAGLGILPSAQDPATRRRWGGGLLGGPRGGGAWRGGIGVDLGSTSQRAGQAHKHTVSQPPNQRLA